VDDGRADTLPGESGAALLAPALLARLERVQLGTRRRLTGQFSAEHRSPRHGTSLDFADYREYHPGDDFRRIDYNLYARLDVLLLKLYEAEDDLTLRLLVDTSKSMAGPKLRQAQRVAAALGFVALVRRDVVTLHTFPLEIPAPRFSGRGAASALFGHLGALTAEGETRFAEAAAHLLARPGPAGLTVVISDLLTPEWEAGIERLPSRGGDLTVVHVLDPDELRPRLTGDLDLVDRETGATLSVSLASDTVAAYERAALQWADGVAARCRRHAAGYVRVLSDADIEPLLLGAWREAGVLR
jgi:uncharacterized protein (DUF58 family)